MHLKCARHHAKCFICIISFNLQNYTMCYYTHFTSKKTEAQRSSVTCPRSKTYKRDRANTEFRQTESRGRVLNHWHRPGVSKMECTIPRPPPPPFSLLLKQAKNLSCPVPFFQILSSPISLFLPQFTSYLDNNNNHLTALAVMHVPHNSQLGFSNKSQTDRVTLNCFPFSDSYNLCNDSNS